MAYQVTNEDGGRTLLIRTALGLLNTVHPEDLSIREVARRAELSSGAPYHHFKTKTDLLAACAVVAWTDLCDQLEDDGANGPLDQLLERAKTYLAAREPSIDRPSAKFLGVSMWSLLHGHLMLNNETRGLLDSHATLDDEIARLATQMAQLPVPSPSFNQ